jgi:guanine deaminase
MSRPTAGLEGVNRVTANLDPSAHAEVTAIRNACQQLGTFDLSGATSTRAASRARCASPRRCGRASTAYFAANRDDAADAGFDDAVFYRYFEGARGQGDRARRRHRPA